jgi:ATP-dependent helicase/nuclease subunit A
MVEVGIKFLKSKGAHCIIDFHMNDESIRQTALTPNQSFIVQAPAGSGKTELLIQRYLSLLNIVEKTPEEILAITFTKKAAREMRERVLQALKLADQPAPPSKTYQYQTWRLASQVMARSQTLKWDLLNTPALLRIQTIDSFCNSLVQQMPLLSRLGSGADLCTDTEIITLYQEAAHRLLMNTAYSNAIQKLLFHFDNKMDQVVALLVSMLSKRDQWLPLLGGIQSQTHLRASLEMNLQNLVNHILQQAQDYFPADLKQEAVELFAYATQNQFACFPAAHFSTLSAWRAFAEKFLTKDQAWRKTISVKEGFPSKDAGSTKEEKQFFQAQKERHKLLLEKLSPLEDLRAALEAARAAPQPSYPDRQWILLEVLLELLPLLVAELKVLFQFHNQVDFIEVTQAAMTALGGPDDPSELAFRLDQQLRHILIDEFQDTSATQFRLLSALTAHWPSEGSHTLFLVGDPMQSIYRFRGAEVGLFLSAKLNGVNQLPLQFLQLQNNFRSQQHIIDWINETFPAIFPEHEDLTQSKIKFTSSLASRPPLDTGVLLEMEGDMAMATRVLQIIQAHQTHTPEDSLAILVRSRSHLLDIIPTLQAHHIDYQAVEIEKLNQNMLIQDLLSLSCALLHLGDTLAWLSVLRSPWVGLSLDDLYLIARAAEGHTIWQALNTEECIQSLSVEGQTALQPFQKVINQSLMNRQRFGFRNEVEQTWKDLQGSAYLHSVLDEENATTFFNLLSELEESDQVIHRELLQRHFEKLYAAASQSTSKIQIMTVHKAKGLEFDTVILPCLEKGVQHDREQLLLWFETPNPDKSLDLLIAPIKPKHHEADLIYQYLKGQQTRIQDYENSRLLYVAVTRARKQLYLLGKLEKDKDGNPKPPPEKSWLGKLLKNKQG